MQSVRQWVDVEADEGLAASIAQHCDLPLPLARVLVARGVDDPAVADRFLQPRLSHLEDPFDLPDMLPAVTRLEQALAGGEHVTVFGDYDADGITATALLVDVLRRLGGEVSWFVPHRLREGYGFTPAALTRCLESRRPALVITVDCGVCSVEAVERARKEGIDVVVTDHHDPAGALAQATAVVNPKCRPGGAKVLAGVGVAFKLCHALLKHRMGRCGTPALDLRAYLDLVAIGTIADVVPLTGENRILVKHGLTRLNTAPRPGVRALAEVSGIKTQIDSYEVGFMLGPRLNAAGRMGDAGPAVELLLGEEGTDVWRIAHELDAANRRRKAVESEILDAAVDELDAGFDPREHYGIVAGQRDWHIGAVGIVASRLCRRYHRPAVVIGFDENDRGRGSCRGIDGISLLEVLQECAEVLTAFGGHDLAAGVSLHRRDLEPFRRKFNAACAARLAGGDLRPVEHVDAWIDLGDADERLHEGLMRLAPSGVGNPAPVWAVRSVAVVGPPRVVGTNHLKMVVAKGGDQRETIGFGLAGKPLPEGAMDLLFELKQNEYRGRKTLQLHLKDFRPEGGGRDAS